MTIIYVCLGLKSLNNNKKTEHPGCGVLRYIFDGIKVKMRSTCHLSNPQKVLSGSNKNAQQPTTSPPKRQKQISSNMNNHSFTREPPPKKTENSAHLFYLIVVWKRKVTKQLYSCLSVNNNDVQGEILYQ